MKIVNIGLSLLFVLFAVVQYNDPDPWLWIAYYIMVAVFCGLTAFQKFYKIPLLIALLGTAFWIGMLVPDFVAWLRDGMPSIVGTMKAESKYIELVREFLGLFMGLAVLSFQFYQLRKASTQ